MAKKTVVDDVSGHYVSPKAGPSAPKISVGSDKVGVATRVWDSFAGSRSPRAGDKFAFYPDVKKHEGESGRVTGKSKGELRSRIAANSTVQKNISKARAGGLENRREVWRKKHTSKLGNATTVQLPGKGDTDWPK